MRNFNIPLLLLILIAFTSCDLFQSNKTTEIELNAKSAALVESNNSFGFGLFEKVIEAEDPNKNIMLSPLSVSQALSMTINGASDETYTQMQQVLGFDGLTLAELNESNHTISSSLVDHDPKVTMKIANSIWYRNDFLIKSDFADNNLLYYSAEVSSYDPSQLDEAKTDINNWVDNKTSGKIDKIIEEVKSDDVMFLINAIYFKAKWKTEFKKKNTEIEIFTLDDGTEKEVETMIGEVELSYYNEEKYSVIKLPYGSGKFNMIVYLPEEGYSTNDIYGAIENTDFEQLSTLTSSQHDLWLPKFEFSYENKLVDELDSMGMHDAFDPLLAKFDGITETKDLYISDVKHKTYIKTDEEGTEAAAATSVVMGETSIGPEGIIKINRSFLFAIVEEDTRSILFIGRVYDPSLSE